jgi:hypothetical protein
MRAGGDKLMLQDTFESANAKLAAGDVGGVEAKLHNAAQRHVEAATANAGADAKQAKRSIEKRSVKGIIVLQFCIGGCLVENCIFSIVVGLSRLKPDLLIKIIVNSI